MTRRPYRRPRLALARARIYRQRDRWAPIERQTLRVVRITETLVVLDHTSGPVQFDRATGWGCRAARGGLGAGAHGQDWSEWRLDQSDWSRVYAETDSASRRDYHATGDRSTDAEE